jgi:glutathione synthase/RimK-type ligase-like ATP-grasp enzyme
MTALRRVLYLFPDRSSATDFAWEHDVFWPAYRSAAEEVGMELAVATPEHIVLAERKTYWRDEQLFPSRDIIVYGVRTNPTHGMDLWSGLSLARSLEARGFWLAIPLAEAILLNEKYATAEVLADSPIPTIPSVRVPTGRDVYRLAYQRLIPAEWFPVFAKPASWGRGLGCVLCPDRATLDGVLGLAAGSGAAMLVQPSVGRVVADIRVVVVEGGIVAMYDRVPAAGAQVANVSRGATHRLRTSLDAPIDELVQLVQQRFDLPYVCIDLLQADDGRIWLAELEADGAVSSLFGQPELVRQVVGERFRAYSKRLDEHLARVAEPATRRAYP